MEEVINFLSFNGTEAYIENSKHINKYKTMQEGVMDILEKAIKHYGPQNQMMMVLEENAELSQAITKYIRSTKKGRFNEIIKARKNVVEEIADVLIVIEQLKIMLDIQNYEINCIKDYKLNRLKERIEKGEQYEKKSN